MFEMNEDMKKKEKELEVERIKRRERGAVEEEEMERGNRRR